MTTYLRRYANPEALFLEPPDKDLALSVVIPCFNEPNIIPALESLRLCEASFNTEVIIIINESENATSTIKETNLATIEQIKKWQGKNALSFTLLFYHLIAPKKHAGVGLARKVGMDEAIRRFEAVHNKEGIICCFDADSVCEPNYLTNIYRHFKEDNELVGASIYYEHLLPSEEHLKEGIIQYELHLRYYAHALQHIGYPYAHQTVGSSMVVRSDAYQRIGGMNKRKAGEDFYFLHRLMPAGKYIDIKNTTVYPSARESDRVPFGTGKAMSKWQESQQSEYLTYNLSSFLDLGKLFKATEGFYGLSDESLPTRLKMLPESIQNFLERENFALEIQRVNQQSTNQKTFYKNWYAFFDGFKVLKFIHYARDHYYPNQSIVSQAKILAQKKWQQDLSEASSLDCLIYYRQQDSMSSAS
jgi:glycosyltransferase involved in cell wall biosynthesis